jgi:hypothetical protein
MKTIPLYGLLVILFLITAFSLFRVFDQAAEIDDLKSQIGLQKNALHFMQDVSNRSMAACAFSVDAFEGVAKMNGHSAVLWQNQVALVGPFRVTRSTSCVTEMQLVGLHD